MKAENKSKLCRKNNPYIVVTWDEIAGFFPLSRISVVKKYGPEMLATGAVYKSKVGHRRTPVVWGFPDRIKKYIALKAEEQHGRI